MMKATRRNKAFTLAELLITVAIIGVLVAIGIPVFSTQLEKSREAADLANIRSEYAQVMIGAVAGETTTPHDVVLTQRKDGWQNTGAQSALEMLGTVTGAPVADGICTISFETDSNTVTFLFDGSKVSFPDVNDDQGFAHSYGKLTEKALGETESFRNYLSGLPYNGKVYNGHTIMTVSLKDGNFISRVTNYAVKNGYSQDVIDKLSNSTNTTAYVDENFNLLGVSYTVTLRPGDSRFVLDDKDGKQLYYGGVAQMDPQKRLADAYFPGSS